MPYAGWLNDSIGYIRHSDFTEGCYEEMRGHRKTAGEGELKGLVLDYRSNGGGIMQEAVKILGLFVPKGTGVVSTKGRTEDSKNSSDPVGTHSARPAAGSANQRQHGFGGRKSSPGAARP